MGRGRNATGAEAALGTGAPAPTRGAIHSTATDTAEVLAKLQAAGGTATPGSELAAEVAEMTLSVARAAVSRPGIRKTLADARHRVGLAAQTDPVPAAAERAAVLAAADALPTELAKDLTRPGQDRLPAPEARAQAIATRLVVDGAAHQAALDAHADAEAVIARLAADDGDRDISHSLRVTGWTPAGAASVLDADDFVFAARSADELRHRGAGEREAFRIALGRRMREVARVRQPDADVADDQMTAAPSQAESLF